MSGWVGVNLSAKGSFLEEMGELFTGPDSWSVFFLAGFFFPLYRDRVATEIRRFWTRRSDRTSERVREEERTRNRVGYEQFIRKKLNPPKNLHPNTPRQGKPQPPTTLQRPKTISTHSPMGIGIPPLACFFLYRQSVLTFLLYPPTNRDT